MSLPRSTEQCGARHAVTSALRLRSGVVACSLVAMSIMLSACGSLPFLKPKKAEPPPTATAPTSSSGGTLSNTPTAAPPTSGGANSGSPAAPPPANAEKDVDEKGRSLFSFRRKKAPPPATTAPSVPKPIEVPAQARTDFDRAVGLMRSGNDSDAQREFKRLATSYPQFASPDINLGILYRKGGKLDQSEEALQEAVSRNRESAVAWNELGVTQRMRGEFKVAQDSYENAIRVDPDFAPAYRNLGVLLDLYVGDADGALDNFERYKELSKEDKPVTSWIAELRQRTGKAIRNKPVAPASDSAAGPESNDNGAADPGASGDAPPADGNASPSSSGEGQQDAAPAAPKRAGG